LISERLGERSSVAELHGTLPRQKSPRNTTSHSPGWAVRIALTVRAAYCIWLSELSRHRQFSKLIELLSGTIHSSALVTAADLQESSRNRSHEGQIVLSGVMKSVTVHNAIYTPMIVGGVVGFADAVGASWLDTFATLIIAFTEQITSSWYPRRVLIGEKQLSSLGALWEFTIMSDADIAGIETRNQDSKMVPSQFSTERYASGI
jgi:hypothetical protein